MSSNKALRALSHPVSCRASRPVRLPTLRSHRGLRLVLSSTAFTLGILAAPAVSAFEPVGIAGMTQDAKIAPDGTIYVVWAAGPATSATLHAGTLDLQSGQVTHKTQIATGANAWFGRPELSVSPNGQHVVAVWHRDLGDHDILELGTRGAGGTWSVSTVVEDGDTWEYTQPSVAVRNDGSVHVAYQQWSTPKDQEYVTYRWRSAGGSFGAGSQVSAKGRRDVAMFVDMHGGLHLRYSRGYRYAPPGSTLDQAQNLQVPKHPQSTDGPFFGEVFVDATDVVHLVFDDCIDCQGTGTHIIGHTTIPVDGSTFSVPTRVSADPFPGEDAWPAVGVDASGRVYVMWCPSDSGTSECKVAIQEPSSSGWAERTLDANAGMSRLNKPTVLVTDSGVVGLWRTDGGSIVMEDLTPETPTPDAGPDALLEASTPDAQDAQDATDALPVKLDAAVDTAADTAGDAPWQDAFLVAPDAGSDAGGHANEDASAGHTTVDDPEEGCGCSTPGHRGGTAPWWTVAAAAAWLVVSRGRRRSDAG